MKTLLSRALDFAHLNGRQAKEAEEDPADPPMGDEEEAAADEAEDGDGEEENPETGGGKKTKKGKKAKKAKGADAEDGDPEDDEEDGDAEGDGDDEDEEGGEDGDKKAAKGAIRKAEARGRRKERARCKAIFASEHASRNVALAAKLAFNTDLAAEAAIVIMESGGDASGGGLHERMARVPQKRIGADGAQELNGQAGIAKSWEAAAAPFMPKKN